MRRELFSNPLLLIERIGEWATDRRRLRRLKSTPAQHLRSGHIDSLELLDLISRECGPPNVIYDVGANVGTWAQLAHSQFPRAEIHAFEPLEKHLARLRKFATETDRVHIHEVALGAKSGIHTLHVTNFSDASSLLELGAKGAEVWGLSESEQINVPVERLDDRIAELALAYPGLIKLDVQGFELEVLTGGTEALRRAHSVLIELSFEEIYEGQPASHEVLGFLAEAGFVLRAFGKGVRLGEPVFQIDALFMRRASRRDD
ncbi:FkbM family methyltransferase [Marivita geojedonensis]|uniref:Methyltransferase FkbM domain-containing protein n=1 Tax=Marivita geojedonensis TaxID=1123756 RepID=A0A1X4NRJ9_9RHOB|nr:FkbM family methyltransferase [Marivita geojedonensis]OSQ53511.1 hypothetical protein MGEO_03030 [Marivita geojedonensis]PRY81480.1 FkbM family methyltransferase [Marivita geojedonensis]